MQIAAPTFSQHIVVGSGRHKLPTHRMRYRLWQPYQNYCNLEFWHGRISYSCLCGTHAEHTLKHKAQRSDDSNSLIFVSLPLASHPLSDISLLSNDQVSSLEYPSSKRFAFKTSLLPLGTWWSRGGQLHNLISREFIMFTADINFENLMSKSFHRWANWGKSEQSSTKPVCYCAGGPQIDPSGHPVRQFRNNRLGIHIMWMQDSNTEANTSIVRFYFTSA